VVSALARSAAKARPFHLSSIANTMRRRGVITTILGKFAAVFVNGYTIGRRPVCVITTATFLL
jgi:hypothetical protein